MLVRLSNNIQSAHKRWNMIQKPIIKSALLNITYYNIDIYSPYVHLRFHIIFCLVKNKRRYK